MNIKKVRDTENVVIRNFIQSQYTEQIDALLSELETKKNFIKLTIKNGTINKINVKQMFDIIQQINTAVLERDVILDFFSES